jgi:hypothetical protein
LTRTSRQALSLSKAWDRRVRPELSVTPLALCITGSFAVTSGSLYS